MSPAHPGFPPPLQPCTRRRPRAEGGHGVSDADTPSVCPARSQRFQLDIAATGDALLPAERRRRRRGWCKPDRPQVARPGCALLPQPVHLCQQCHHTRASSAQPTTLAGRGLRAELLPAPPAGLELRAGLLQAALPSAARATTPVASPRAAERHHRAAEVRAAALRATSTLTSTLTSFPPSPLVHSHLHPPLHPHLPSTLTSTFEVRAASLRAAAAAPAAAPPLRLGRHRPACGKPLWRHLARLGGHAGRRAPRRALRGGLGRGLALPG